MTSGASRLSGIVSPRKSKLIGLALLNKPLPDMLSSRYLLLIVAVSLLSCSSTAEESTLDGHTIEALSHPESVAHDPDGDAFYAANIGEELAPTEKDEDGFISRLASDGTVETRDFLPSSDDATLHAPKGTLVLNGHLYTADIDRVVGFDLEERTKAVEISLADEGVEFLNDIAVLDDQTLVGSATNQGSLYRINLDDETVTELDVEIPGANGVAYSESQNALYAVNFGGDQGGQLWTISLDENGEVSDASSRTILEGGRFDGIVLQDDEQVVISDWGIEDDAEAPPALHLVEETGSGSVSTIELSDWQGPADFTCVDGACWIPDLPASVVHIVRPDERADG